MCCTATPTPLTNLVVSPFTCRKLFLLNGDVDVVAHKARSGSAAGSDVAMHSASVALMNNDLKRLPFLIRLSRTTRRVVAQNLLFGVMFIILGMVLVSLEWVSAIVAAMMHTASSLVIVFNSARLVRFGEELGFAPTADSGTATATEDRAADQATPAGTVQAATAG